MGLVAIALAAGCSSREHSSAAITRAIERTPATIVVDGQTIEVAPLREALNGLCQARHEAATDPRTAKAIYDRRAQVGVDAAVRILRRSYSVVASSMAAAVGRIDAAPADVATLADDLARLAQLTRDGLARLGVTTSPCAT